MIKKLLIMVFLFAVLFVLMAAFSPTYAEVFAEDLLPEYVDLSDTNSGIYFFPEIADQSWLGACAAYATVYYQFTYEVAKYMNEVANDSEWVVNDGMETDYSKVFSPVQVYNLLNCASSNEGTNPVMCYQVLEEFGAVRYDEFDRSVASNNKWFCVKNQNGEIDKDITAQKLLTALKTRVTSYGSYAINSNGSDALLPAITSYNDSDLFAIKKKLSDGHVLVFGTNINSINLEHLSSGQGINNPNDQIVTYLRQTLNVSGGDDGHIMTIVGYDDRIWYDYNNDGIAQDNEKGAFKVANSWGDNWCNNGYVFVSYDAINKVSNFSALNFEDRLSAIQFDGCYYIDVAEFTPALTVEVDIEQKDRGAFTISLGRRWYYEDTLYNSNMRNYFVAWDGDESIATDFNGRKGINASYDSRVFVFDYTNAVSYNGVYNIGQSKVYDLIVSDIDSYDGFNTKVEKVCWRDANGYVVRSITPNDVLYGEDAIYSSGIYVSNVSLNRNYLSIKAGETDQLVATVLPSNATFSDIVWSSSDTSVAVVDDNGFVIFVSSGTVTITARSVDGSGVYSTCDYTVSPIFFSYNNTHIHDARRLRFSISAPQNYNVLLIHIGERCYDITRPIGNYDNYINNDRIKVEFSVINGSYLNWNIQICLSQPTVFGATESVWFQFIDSSLQGIIVRSNMETGFVFYGSSVKTGIEPGTTINQLLSDINGDETGFYYSVIDGETHQSIVPSNNTKAATGMIILKKFTFYSEGIAYEMIAEVIYLVIFGDVYGNGTVGDGIINMDDALAGLRHAAQTGLLSTKMFEMAADVNHDGIITQADAQQILYYANNMGVINQNYVFTTVPPELYYDDSVVFS